MRISVVPLTDPEAAYPVHQARWDYDEPDIPVPPLRDFVAELSNPRPDVAFERYLGLLDGEPAGYLELSMPQLDNLGNVMVQLGVHPERRRLGVGRALHETAVRRTRELGRQHLSTVTIGRHPDGAAFAAAAGATVALEEKRSRLDLTALDEPRLRELLADAWEHAAGYRLVQWTQVPPEEIIESVARLESSFLEEAPTGDLAWEPEKVDADRVRRDEESMAERGRITRHTGALHGDRLVAWTTIVGRRGTHGHAWQSLTLVEPAHRGHRLGILVKIANLEYVRTQDPALFAIDTVNGDVNDHMLRINRAMGFREVDSVAHWQLAV